jgi:hypothetical protein
VPILVSLAVESSPDSPERASQLLNWFIKEVSVRTILFVCMILAAPFTFAQGFMIDSSACDFHKLVNDHLAPDDSSMSEGSAQAFCRLSSPTQIRCAYDVIAQNAYLHNFAGFSAVLKGCAEAERLHFDEHAF